ncbi:MAG: transcriptional repressor [Saccharofermentans sp.]|nr:transcriptional repressor [Saccharofermentans sp.]
MTIQPTALSAQDRLREAGIRVTGPRVAILDFLMKDKSHPTCDRIFEAVKANSEKMSLASVYNVTEKLYEAGLVRRLLSPDGEYHYDGVYGFHGHFFCNKCNSIYDIKCDRNINYEELDGAVVQTVALSTYGICPQCN